jgi:hypothetical protein
LTFAKAVGKEIGGVVHDCNGTARIEDDGYVIRCNES